ncbi:NirD/YgiW/YdeI family stress tolerance protein [Kistimonas asteriae]|uniref:NirD/YgiW/YdeI family stress tolerance protein n=1 Tax=Kistimonas asteriae TaxID=517724 RepID=UPI001BA55D14|nr:NirD/YgiW/YdeI family stress tolerance protein [Kistimonas asteriae]
MRQTMKHQMIRGMALVAVLGASTPLWAQYAGPGSETIKTVEEAKNASDEVPVVLTGHIVRQVNREDYLFRDSTGEISVEIDGDEWGAIREPVTPEMTVRISGEVDYHRTEPTDIDVKQVEIIETAYKPTMTTINQS